jgi:hypothetical protein
LSKDYLDRTLEHDPDRGPDQVADRTLNRDPARKPDRDSPGEGDRTVKLRPGSDEEAAVGERGKPGADPDGKPVAAARRKPVATPASKPVATAAGKPAANAAGKPVAAPAKKIVLGKGQKPVAGPGKKTVAAAGDHAAAGPSTADATVVLRTRATPLDAGVADVDAGAPDVDASVADMAPPASPDMTVEMRAERRVEVIIPMEMQVMIEVPGAGKVSGATENMSCNGMLARLNGPVQPDSRCQVHFLGTDDVAPSQVFGRIIRIAKSRFGYSVAFRFERPVQLRVAPPRPKKRTKDSAD